MTPLENVPIPHVLKPVLSTLQLWGIAVGLVISGEYFGWSYGWASAGTLGFTITSIFVAAMYTTFIFSFTELTTSIPQAGGPFAYSKRAYGPTAGYLAGAATLIEFVFAPPAIASWIQLSSRVASFTSIIGPINVASSTGLPAINFFVLATSRSRNAG